MVNLITVKPIGIIHTPYYENKDIPIQGNNQPGLTSKKTSRLIESQCEQ
jgi:hypothetical protein